ncbi:unnamed protein product [Prunus armeniaca]
MATHKGKGTSEIPTETLQKIPLKP